MRKEEQQYVQTDEEEEDCTLANMDVNNAPFTIHILDCLWKEMHSRLLVDLKDNACERNFLFV